MASCDQVSAKNEVTTEQLQRIEVSKKRAKAVKTKRGRPSHNPCAVCLELIIDGKHEAIFCEGRCNMWYHRGYASVSQKLLQELTTSEEPFLFLMCSRAACKEEVSQLKSEIVSLKNELTKLPSLQSSTKALRREIKDLKCIVSKFLSELKTSVSKIPPNLLMRVQLQLALKHSM